MTSARQFSLRVTPLMDELIDEVVEEGWYRSRSELLRDGARRVALDPSMMHDSPTTIEPEDVEVRAYVRLPEPLYQRLEDIVDANYAHNVSDLIRVGAIDVIREIDAFDGSGYEEQDLFARFSNRRSR